MIVSNMGLNKLMFLITVGAQLLIGCNQKTIDSNCGEVSTRVMYSKVNSKFERIEITLNSSNLDSSEILRYLSNIMNINDQLVIEAGGFKEGKSLEIISPCLIGGRNYNVFNQYNAKQSYYGLAKELFKTKLINEGQLRNLNFIIDSYFCEEGCTFSNESLKQKPVGILLLENLVLQNFIFDIALQ